MGQVKMSPVPAADPLGMASASMTVGRSADLGGCLPAIDPVPARADWRSANIAVGQQCQGHRRVGAAQTWNRQRR